MKRSYLTYAVAWASPMLLLLCPAVLMAGELVVAPVVNLRHGTKVEMHRPQSNNQCTHETCISRTAVHECVPGKKLVYATDKRCEYVTIAETHYRFKKRLITKKVPADYCKTVCKDEDTTRCHMTEKWDSSGGTCGQVHCKSCVPESEKVACKKSSCEPGKTYIKVHYWTCVKEPYTVYRQIRRPICVKKPRYEHVQVPITRYVCDHCNQGGCNGDSCDDPGCTAGCAGQ